MCTRPFEGIFGVMFRDSQSLWNLRRGPRLQFYQELCTLDHRLCEFGSAILMPAMRLGVQRRENTFDRRYCHGQPWMRQISLTEAWAFLPLCCRKRVGAAESCEMRTCRSISSLVR